VWSGGFYQIPETTGGLRHLFMERQRCNGGTSMSDTNPLDVERAVRERYGAAALEPEAALCCPVAYDPRHIEAIPEEVLERDYGCGDPSRYVREGDRVLDLGSGGGKICFIASQIVGPRGSVIGIDVNDEMLALARRWAPEVARRVGFANVEFRRGRIQDLCLDLDRLDAWLAVHPVKTSEDLGALEAETARLHREHPLVPDASVDLVVSDAPVPAELQADPELWSGCISGAFEERRLLRELEDAGLSAVSVAQRAGEPFAVVEGIGFRSVTVTAHKEGAEPSSGAVAGSGCKPDGCC
jgi:SAM-dependent methyltransferase